MSTTVYGVMPQDVATDVNLSTSISQWLQTQVKTPYDARAAALNLTQGYYTDATGKWQTDTQGLYIFEGRGPADPRLYMRLPAISYQIDDTTGGKPSKPTGMGDGAVFEYIKILLCCAPVPNVATDGSSEPDPLAKDVLKTFLRNATQRTLYFPIVDYSAGASGNPALYPMTGNAKVVSAQVKTMTRELQEMMVNQRERFDVEIMIEWPVQTTNGQ